VRASGAVTSTSSALIWPIPLPLRAPTTTTARRTAQRPALIASCTGGRRRRSVHIPPIGRRCRLPAGNLDAMARSPRPLPASLGDVFSVAQAREAGVSNARLRHRDLLRPFRAARMCALPPEPDDDAHDDVSPVAREAKRLRAEISRRARALAAIAPEEWFFSHITAAVLWQLPLPIRVLRLAVDGNPRSGEQPRGIDIAVLGADRAPRGAGMCGHQLRPVLTAVRVRDGLRVASPATTWAQLAPLLSVDELIELGDAIVHIPRRRGMQRGTSEDALGTLAQLESAMTAGRRAGIATLREAFPQIRVGSASPGETRVRLSIVRSGLPDPDLDIDVFAADGSAIGYTELGYSRWRVLIEFEGDHHRRDRAQWARDIDKHADCVAAGFDVVRLTAAHAYPSTAPAVQRVRAALLRAGWRPE